MESNTSNSNNDINNNDINHNINDNNNNNNRAINSSYKKNNKVHPIVNDDISVLNIPITRKPKPKPKQKDTIPKALREQVWIQTIGKDFDAKCPTRWCKNRINPFDFHVGHNIPEAKGGTLDINNLKPICSRCNLSMNTQYTIDAWNNLSTPKRNCCIIM